MRIGIELQRHIDILYLTPDISDRYPDELMEAEANACAAMCALAPMLGFAIIDTMREATQVTRGSINRKKEEDKSC